jgi:hypothetical protein
MAVLLKRAGEAQQQILATKGTADWIAIGRRLSVHAIAGENAGTRRH